MRQTSALQRHVSPIRSPRASLLLMLTAVAVVYLGAACSESPTAANPRVQAERGGKGGGGGGGKGGGGADPQVDATDPAGAPRGVTRDVRIFGSNFEDGSVAEFLLAGQSTGDITTNSTSFVSATELVANVTIDAFAATALYDVQVRTPRNKKGIGIELFEVLTGLVATGGMKTIDGTGAVREEDVAWAPENSPSTLNVGIRFTTNALADLVEVDFSTSVAAAGAIPGNCSNGSCGACRYIPADLDQTDPAALVAMAGEMVKAGADRTPSGIRFNLDIKRLKSPGDVSASRSHTVQTEYWSPYFDRRVEVGMRQLSKSLGGTTPTVELVEKDEDNGDGRLRSTYRVIGGSVRVWPQNYSVPGGPPTGPGFSCPLLDPVTLSVLRTPQP